MQNLKLQLQALGLDEVEVKVYDSISNRTLFKESVKRRGEEGSRDLAIRALQLGHRWKELVGKVENNCALVLQQYQTGQLHDLLKE